MSFIGSAIISARQALGLVNDHVRGCFKAPR
jgi:hypothetical protein